LRSVYTNLGDLYASKEDFKKAYEYQEKLFEAERILYDENNRVNLLKAASDYELDKKALQLRLERENYQKRQTRIIFISILIITVLLGWFVRYRKRQKIQEALSYKLKELEADQQILLSAQN